MGEALVYLTHDLLISKGQGCSFGFFAILCQALPKSPEKTFKLEDEYFEGDFL
jgi:hypothetical protein